MSGALTVIAAGPLATIQDGGRPGYGRMGVSPSGACDWFSAAAANRLVGNADGAPLIELTLTHATLEADADAVLAVTGAQAALSVDGVRRSSWRSFAVRAGERLVVGPARHGARTYVAVGGGFTGVPAVLGSVSTDVGGGFGGRVLARGDALGFGGSEGERIARPDLAYASGRLPSFGPPARLRTILGPDADRLDAGERDALSTREFRASSRSSRQALVLDTEMPSAESARGQVSMGMCAGCVQIAGDGRPIVLLAEHQTTGGYPVALCVVRADLPLAAQVRSGDAVAFDIVSTGGARDALVERMAQLRSLAPIQEGSLQRDRLAGGFLEGAPPP